MRRFWIGLAGGSLLGYAAVRAYGALEDLKAPAETLPKDPSAYGRTRRALMLAGIARSTALLAWAAFDLAPASRRGQKTTDGRLRRVGLIALGTLGSSALDLCSDYVEDYVLERRFGLSRRTAGAWLAERTKSLAVSLVMMLAVLELFVEISRRAPKRWPLIGTLIAGPLLIVANLVFPLFILPLFNTFEPVTGDLERRLRALATRYGVGDAQILRVDMSRQTEKANAYVAGLFGTHRIVIGDTLLGNFEDAEIEFIIAHELGHYVRHDVWRSVAVGTLAAGAVLFGGRALASSRPASLENVDVLARFAFYANAIALLLGPALAAFSRSREWAADEFALAATGAPQTGASAFARLRERNLSEDEQPLWMELLFSTHPPLRARIAALEAART